MLRKSLALAAVCTLSGCGPWNSLGVFLVRVPVVDTVGCTTSINENIDESDPPVGATTGTTDWVYTSSFEMSDALMFMQVFRGHSKTDDVYVQLGDDLYVGTETKGVITVAWQNYNHSSETTSNGVAGYQYATTDDTEIDNTITLTPNKDLGGYSGNWASSTASTLYYEESDEWDIAEYPNSGSINTPIFTWLEGSGSNSGDRPDCASDPCFVEVNTTCNGSQGFTAVETDLDPDDYTGVEDAGQDAGAF